MEHSILDLSNEILVKILMDHSDPLTIQFALQAHSKFYNALSKNQRDVLLLKNITCFMKKKNDFMVNYFLDRVLHFKLQFVLEIFKNICFESVDKKIKNYCLVNYVPQKPEQRTIILAHNEIIYNELSIMDKLANELIKNRRMELYIANYAHRYMNKLMCCGIIYDNVSIVEKIIKIMKKLNLYESYYKDNFIYPKRSDININMKFYSTFKSLKMLKFINKEFSLSLSLHKKLMDHCFGYSLDHSKRITHWTILEDNELCMSESKTSEMINDNALSLFFTEFMENSSIFRCTIRNKSVGQFSYILERYPYELCHFKGMHHEIILCIFRNDPNNYDKYIEIIHRKYNNYFNVLSGLNLVPDMFKISKGITAATVDMHMTKMQIPKSFLLEQLNVYRILAPYCGKRFRCNIAFKKVYYHNISLTKWLYEKYPKQITEFISINKNRMITRLLEVKSYEMLKWFGSVFDWIEIKPIEQIKSANNFLPKRKSKKWQCHVIYDI